MFAYAHISSLDHLWCCVEKNIEMPLFNIFVVFIQAIPFL